MQSNRTLSFVILKIAINKMFVSKVLLWIIKYRYKLIAIMQF
ncbi:hypothetical protein BN1325_110094 [Staphylococcus aureus]|nr:hypothetical protein SAET23_120092 [Staphylococcus aureus]CRI14181.1 hypothetical protein BN1325_110094 [Staphylococcus aureus]CRI18320.1 hypothetical protein SAET23_120092 [Staphylococcus aureus]CRI20647.1 hypothetical protein BN1323_340333 [Staphylococcus aureus]CRI23374.1 hypothetical protein BN1325_110094 [Staphylococcus aureus]